MGIAADICVYTNRNWTIETLNIKEVYLTLLFTSFVHTHAFLFVYRLKKPKGKQQRAHQQPHFQHQLQHRQLHHHLQLMHQSHRRDHNIASH
jgi:hypothetical protein